MLQRCCNGTAAAAAVLPTKRPMEAAGDVATFEDNTNEPSAKKLKSCDFTIIGELNYLNISLISEFVREESDFISNLRTQTLV